MDMSKDYMRRFGVADAMRFGNGTYAVCTEGYDRVYMVAFNKRILKEMGYAEDYIYKLVDAGNWTIDEYNKLSKAAVKDLDGKPRMSDADQYGQVMIYHETGISAALFANVGTSMIKIDSNDKLTYNMNDPLIVNTVTSIGEIARNGSRYVNDEWRSRVAFFASGKALFMWASITNIPSIVNTAENNGEKCFKNEIVLSCPPHESVSYEIGEKFPEKTVLGAFLNLSFENELNEEVYLCQLPIKAEIETKTEIKKSALIVKEDFCFTAKGENAVFKVSKQTGELISVDYSGEI